MAAPMRDSPLDGATHGSTAAKAPTKAKQGTAQGGSSEPTATTTTSTNFEYDDNEWDVGIGDLIIDLDADIEKTNEKSVPGPGTGSGAVAGSGGGGGGGGVAPAAAQTTPTPAAMAAAGKTGKLAVEHSATVDKGLKMKIKRTKPGTKTSEAKHEIVKPGEQLNGAAPGAGNGNDPLAAGGGNAAPPLHAPPALNANMNSVNSCASGAVASGKRGSSSHRRDKKHAEKSSPGIVKTPAGPTPGSTPAGPGPLPPPPVATPPMVATVPGPGPVVVPPSQPVATPVQNSDVNGLVRTPVQRVVFPVAVSGPGPPVSPNAPGPPASAPPPLPASPSAKDAPKGVPAAPVPAASPAALVNSTAASSASLPHDDSPAPPTVPPSSPSPPLIKKIKTAPVDPKDMLDVCVGTSVGTITEPDCLGPCEPGTSVNLEGIVWHETEGVLVVNVTWRGKTYVGTLLDCTRHDWAPPRFCDSPTSDLDARTPKGRGKRGRGSSNSNSGNDLSNFTETRSSVHSKLRSNSSTNNNGNNKTSSGRRGPPASSPTPFVPPRPDSGTKRKNRCEEEQQQSPVNGKKTKPAPGASSSSSTSLPPPPSPATPVTSNGSGSPPPTSPVLLECPEPNCSKKYKNINGLKYHQSHAHGGSTDENEDKEMTSLSENEEVPSPPESLVPNKCDISNSSTKKDEPMMVDPPPPVATPVAPATAAPEPMVSTVPVLATPPGPAQIVPPQPEKVVPPERILPSDAEMTSDPTLIKQSAGVLRFGLTDESAKTATVLSVPSPNQRPVSPVNKVPQFKVKPTSALMPEADKKDRNNVKILQQQKKKSKKSPTSSPHLNVMEPNFMEQSSGREDVQSPAYSDISDDTAPVLEAETDNKSKVINCEKKSESGTAQSPHSLQHYVFPYYGNPPYLVPSVQTDNKGKELEKTIPETKPVSNLDKEKKETNVGTEYPPKLLEPHFYPYGYVPGYQYGNMGSYPVGMVAGEKDCKEDNLLKSPSPAEQNLKQAPPAHITSLPPKIKTESGKLPEKPPTQQNENHQILKESIEIKNQMPPAFIYPRQQSNQPGQPQAQPQPQQVVQQQQQQQEDLRRYYLFSGDQRPRKDSSSEAPMKATPPPVATKQPPQMPLKMKDKYPESEKNSKDTEKIKQEGVKPTMETQGPPPPPTSSYAYIHPSSYMQSPHYGAIPFDPSHSMYRNMNPMLVPGPYGNNPYLHPQLHPQIPRYHAPEDLSRSPSGPKALDLLQHHANQYYSSHKIHELQERAMKSPTPKSVTPGISPSGGGAPNLPQQQTQSQQQQQQVQQQQSPGSITPQPPGGPPPPNKTPTDKDSRSPPPQRHVHTHHHTHVGVGLGYPIVAGHYPAPYGAAVLASQQAAAVASTVGNNYPAK